MNCDLFYCSEIFMVFGSFNYNVVFFFFVLENGKCFRKGKKKIIRIGWLKDFIV